MPATPHSMSVPDKTVNPEMSASAPYRVDAGTPVKSQLHFGGHSLAELFTRECAESLDGLCAYNLLRSPAKGLPLTTIDPKLELRQSIAWPAGFVHASPPPQGWSNTMWTRDVGVFLRELTLWGRVEEARLVATALMELVESNEDGFYSFPERFQGGHPRHGRELDGTSAIVIAFVLLAERLPKDDQLRRRLDEFLTNARSPLAFVLHELGSKPLLEGSGEFGPGCCLPGTACNVVQNHLCALALEAGARWASVTGRAPLAQQWRDGAARLRQGIDKHLVAEDGGWIWCVDPVTLKPDPVVLNHAMNRGFGGINGVAAMHCDVHGLIPPGGAWQQRCEATVDRLHKNPQRAEAMRRWGMWTQFDVLAANGKLNSTEHPGELTSPAYGHGYATQLFLLFDRVDLAALALDGLAEHTFNKGQRRSPYYFFERMYAPPRPLQARDGCAELNLVCACEPLKIARMVAGFDDHDPAHPAWIPRLPPQWPRMEISDWPLLGADGWHRIDASLERRADGLHVHLSVRSGVLPSLTIRPHPGAVPSVFANVRELKTVLPHGGDAND